MRLNGAKSCENICNNGFIDLGLKIKVQSLGGSI